MPYEVPPDRRAAIRKALEAMMASRRVVLTTHVNADGDGIGSQIAVAAWLRALGAEVWIVNPTPYPEMFDFLRLRPSCVVDVKSERAEAICRDADLAVVLDTGEVSRIGRVRPLIRSLRTVVIDHHPPGDEPISGISFRDSTASATGELVYDLLTLSGGPWPSEALDGMYVAMLTDTGSFRFSNSTPNCHRVAAELIERGADPEALHRRVYGTAPLRRFELLRAALETLQSEEDSGVSWMIVPHEVCQSLGATPDDFEGLVDYPRAVRGTEIGILFRQTDKGDTKISFRSTGSVDVNQLARQFGGGGHTKASGALVSGGIEGAVPKVLEAARRAVRASLDGEPVREGVGS